eukprot:8445510-Alexandrium_andersonii.AAC.1
MASTGGAPQSWPEPRARSPGQSRQRRGHRRRRRSRSRRGKGIHAEQLPGRPHEGGPGCSSATPWATT